jgi:hypothetical protein
MSKPSHHILIIAAFVFSCYAATANAQATKKALPNSTIIVKVDVLKNGKKIKTEEITAGGVRDTYMNISKNVQQYGVLGVQEWKRQAYNMTAVTRCSFLLETFFAIQGIKEGALDSTPAIEATANQIITALGQVNEESQVSCEPS